MPPWRLPLAAAIVVATLPTTASSVGVGFCLDQAPPSLAGTGYTAVSTLTQAECAPDSWCPLLNDGCTWPHYDLSVAY